MQPTTPPVLPYATDEKPRRWRIVLGFVVAIATGLTSGAVVATAGFGVFPAWFLFSIATPLVAAFAAPARRRFMAVLAAVSMNGMVIGRIAFFPDGGYPPQLSDLFGVLLLFLVLAAFSVMGAWAIGSAVERPAA